jgi:nucleotide-binding universal stress UspA family protein
MSITGQEGSQGPIAVGVDASPGSDAALAWAVQTARQTGASIVAIHTVSPTLFLQGHSMFASLPTQQQWGEWLEDVARVTKEWCSVRIPGDVPWVTETIEGDAYTLLEHADALDARMIVVGRRGRSAMAELFLGSYSHRVVHLAHRPVVVIPPR